MNWYDVDPTLRRHVTAEEPAALKSFAERYLFKPHRIDYRYTSESSEWHALPYKRFVSVPAPIDLVMLSVVGHEVGHVLAGKCPDSGAHFDRREGNKLRCLECERIAWSIAEPLLPPPTGEMHQRMQSALGSYRSVVLAPPDAQRAADAHMSQLHWMEQIQARRKWEFMAERQQIANADLARMVELRRRFAAMQARQDAARRTL